VAVHEFIRYFSVSSPLPAPELAAGKLP